MTGFARLKTVEIVPARPWIVRSRPATSTPDAPTRPGRLTDCISFVVMTDRGLTEALTGDHHFEQANFRPPPAGGDPLRSAIGPYPSPDEGTADAGRPGRLHGSAHNGSTAGEHFAVRVAAPVGRASANFSRRSSPSPGGSSLIESSLSLSVLSTRHGSESGTPRAPDGRPFIVFTITLDRCTEPRRPTMSGDFHALLAEVGQAPGPDDGNAVAVGLDGLSRRSR